MVETVSSWIAVHYFRFRQALADHIFRYLCVIRAIFFFPFACHTDRLVIVSRQDPLISLAQFDAAPFTLESAGKHFFPVVFHFFISFRKSD